MTSQPETDAERIARRYPPRRTSTPVLLALGLAIVALVGYVIWVASYRANPPVTGRIDAFFVVSDTLTRAQLTVDRPNPATAVSCLIAVQAVTYERVGEKQIEVPGGGDRLTTIPIEIRTFKRGTAVTVDNCVPRS